MLRCTEYDGTTGGILTNTSIQAEGCQCMQIGDALGGAVKVTLENCQIEITP